MRRVSEKSQMAAMTNDKKEELFTVLFVGSRKFDREDDFFFWMDFMREQFEAGDEQGRSITIGRIVAGGEEGADAMARKWAERNGIKFVHMDWLDDKRSSMMTRVIPKGVIEADPVFMNTMEKFLKYDVKAVALLPSDNGELGVTAINVKRVAEMAAVSVEKMEFSKLGKKLGVEIGDTFDAPEVIDISDVFKVMLEGKAKMEEEEQMRLAKRLADAKAKPGKTKKAAAKSKSMF